ncbi:superoxide dismutase, Fe-Mn family [Pedobacter steynii]|uniref:Superoxide dismutase n=1 Tax=Pedobacter steynii TaxID=430522 RepID=A0A1H0BBG8_9SPHI|nr:superoxide dismutase [Pedobacter steynii]NQX41101.1 superoxide dismutase [Pedobacter steynii]SDN42979.1 superoxide dismutase, Fe-Mn family [Pedobacter steynii]
MKLLKSFLPITVLLLSTQVLSAQFKLPTLPYATNALEPAIDKQTMEIHHGKHHAAYVNNLNAALKGASAEGKSLADLLAQVSKYPAVIRNNAGGHFNHSLFWLVMTPKPKAVSPTFLKEINGAFGTMDKFKAAFADSAAKRFGSGWAWLIVQNGKLKITTTGNQDNPLMDVVAEKGKPILALDVWEHAYYLKYQNKRPDYISAWWTVVNWAEVERRFNEVKK